MPNRIRNCVECPQCLTRYLIGFSPYGNGSYLVPAAPFRLDEYTLYCACRSPMVCSHWRQNEMKTYEVSREAYRRGYGTAGEVPITRIATEEQLREHDTRSMNRLFVPARD